MPPVITRPSFGMLELDIRTLFFVATLTTLLMAIAMVVLWRTIPGERACRYWAAGGALVAAAFLSVWLRGLIPDFVSIVLANAMFAAGYGLVVIGVNVFTGRPGRLGWLVAVTVGVFAWAAYFTYGVPDVGARIVVISTVTGAMALWCAGRLVIAALPGMRLTQGVTAAVFVLHGVPMLVRAAVTQFGGEATTGLFAPSTLQTVVFVDVTLAAIGLAFGFAAMTTRRLHLNLERLASHDPLTGLLNRHALDVAIEREMARSARHLYPLSVLLMDLDHFKRVNDTYGHDAGDAVLKAFAEVAAGVLRRDDVLGRQGGEEFMALLPGSDRSSALRVAERIRAAVAATPIEHEGRAITVTVSIGVATAMDRASWDDALRAADAALYEAKHSGRDRVVV